MKTFIIGIIFIFYCVVTALMFLSIIGALLLMMAEDTTNFSWYQIGVNEKGVVLSGEGCNFEYLLMYYTFVDGSECGKLTNNE